MAQELGLIEKSSTYTNPYVFKADQEVKPLTNQHRQRTNERTSRSFSETTARDRSESAGEEIKGENEEETRYPPVLQRFPSARLQLVRSRSGFVRQSNGPVIV